MNTRPTDNWFECELEELMSLVWSDLPKDCIQCGTLFMGIEEYLANTEKLTGDKLALVLPINHMNAQLKLFRQCRCGSVIVATSMGMDMAEMPIWKWR